MVRGEIYFLDLHPRSGSEQSGRRPGIISNLIPPALGRVVVIRDVASQLSLRAVRTKRHGNPTEWAHAAPPAHFMANHVIVFQGHATPRHTVPAILNPGRCIRGILESNRPTPFS